MPKKMNNFQIDREHSKRRISFSIHRDHLIFFKYVFLIGTSFTLILLMIHSPNGKEEKGQDIIRQTASVPIVQTSLGEKESDQLENSATTDFEDQVSNLDSINQKLSESFIKLNQKKSEKIFNAKKYEEKLRNEKILRALKIRDEVQRELRSKNFIEEVYYPKSTF